MYYFNLFLLRIPSYADLAGLDGPELMDLVHTLVYLREPLLGLRNAVKNYESGELVDLYSHALERQQYMLQLDSFLQRPVSGILLTLLYCQGTKTVLDLVQAILIQISRNSFH